VRAVEVDLRVAPVRAQQPDGLVHPGAARREILAERLVLGFLPADTDAQAHAAARQRVERAHLLGHQRRMPLRQHEHLGAERHARGDGREVRERHQGLEDRHGGRVRTDGAAGHRIAHDDVIEHVDVVVTDLLDRAGHMRVTAPGPSRYDTLGNSTLSFT